MAQVRRTGNLLFYLMLSLNLAGLGTITLNAETALKDTSQLPFFQFHSLLISPEDDAKSYYLKGLAYYHIHAWDEAIEAFNRSLSLEPKNSDARILRGYAKFYRQTTKNLPGTNDKVIRALFEENLLEDDPSLKFIQLYALLDYSLEDYQSYYLKGRVYYQTHAWNEAIDALNASLRLQPKNLDARLFLGYSHLLRYLSKDALIQSEKLFNAVLEENPKNSDALHGLERLKILQNSPKTAEESNAAPHENGIKLEEIQHSLSLVKAHPNDAAAHYILGRLYYESKIWDRAIDAFESVLSLDPKNQDAQVSLAYSLLFQYQAEEDVKESIKEFQEVLAQDSSYLDAKQGLDRAVALLPLPNEKKAPAKTDWEMALLKSAKAFSEAGQHGCAIEIYQELARSFPENSEYLFLLGREYAAIEYRATAIAFFEESLNIKPDNSDVLIALGNQYLFFHQLCISRELFSDAAVLAPSDPAAFVGLARTEALLNRFETAERYFDTALFLQPENPDVLYPYASFLLGRRRFTESESVYRYLSDLQNDRKTYRTSIFNTSAFTHPTLWITGGSTKEKEKDLFTGKWVASLLTSSAESRIIYPVSDRLRLSLRGGWIDVKQSNLISKTTLFDVKALKYNVGAEIFPDPYWTILASTQVEWISNNDSKATLLTKRGTKIEPSAVFRYSDDQDTVVFGGITDSWIFKNFAKKYTSVFTRETALISYAHNFDDHRLFGADAAWLWYQDPIYNQEQDLGVWAQAAVPYLEDLITAMYHMEYRQFREQTSGYYSFNYQLTHWLKFVVAKTWDFGGHSELLYWHGWRTTRGQNPQQQITVSPAPAILPDVTIEDQIDNVTLTVGYTPSTCLDFSLVGNYWHDSFDYTVWSGKFLLQWRF